jgi:hypothetical protein
VTIGKAKRAPGNAIRFFDLVDLTKNHARFERLDMFHNFFGHTSHSFNVPFSALLH